LVSVSLEKYFERPWSQGNLERSWSHLGHGLEGLVYIATNARVNTRLVSSCVDALQLIADDH